MDSKRQAKFSRELQRYLGDIFLRESRQMFDVPYIGVTNIRVSPDLSYVKVYLSLLNQPNPQEIVAKVQAHKKEIRTMLAAQIKDLVRKIPEIEFYYDDTMDYVEKMDKIFKELNAQPQSSNDQHEDYQANSDDKN